jgi:hypothetical protein
MNYRWWSMLLVLLVIGAVLVLSKLKLGTATAPSSLSVNAPPVRAVVEMPAVMEENETELLKKINISLAELGAMVQHNALVLENAQRSLARETELLDEINEVEDQYERGSLTPTEYLERRARIGAKVLPREN